MAVQINSYSGLQTALLDWLARSGDTELSNRFDDFLALMERRMYYGYATEDPNNAFRSDPLRIPEMQTALTSFALSATTAQPTGFLELISANLNSPQMPMAINAERIIDGYGTWTPTPDTPFIIAISGTNFRVFPDPGNGAYTATIRFYNKLTTPSGVQTNTILQTYPDLYLNGILLEASIYSQALQEAQAYLSMYNASVSGLNARRERMTASANPQIRIRAGMVV